MNRKTALASIEYAGYHNDTKTMTRLYIENRISYQAAQESFNRGIAKRQNGMKCTCKSCMEGHQNIVGRNL
jgi:hypothetical protein